LPAQPNAFIGRERELDDLVELIASDRARLITITGPGGVGKTRLALEAASRLAASFSEGVWFVDLSQLAAADAVPRAVADALRIPLRGAATMTEELALALTDTETLLVLDNFEHLLPAAAHVSRLLRGAPRVKILVTSRTLLDLYGEHNAAISALAVPDDALGGSERLIAYDAVRLFVERARAANRNFALTEQNAPGVARLCLAFEGMPLAIELVAAQLKTRTVDQLAEELARRLDATGPGPRDTHPRHATLRAAIEWSVRLLDDDARVLFKRLSLFSGHFTIEAARAVCGASTPALGSLVQSSLVQEEPGPAFTMLETVREFAAELLADSPEMEPLRASHAAYYSAYAAAEYDALHAGDAGAIKRASADRGNFASALQWAATNEPRQAVRIGDAIWRMWVRGGLAGGEQAALYEAAQHVPADDPVKGEALAIISQLARLEGDHQRSETLKREALSILRSVESNPWLPALLTDVADAELERGNITEARRLGYEALELRLAARPRSEVGIARTLFTLSDIALAAGELEHAARDVQDGMRRLRAAGSTWNLAAAHIRSAEIARRQGKLAEARSLALAGLELSASQREWAHTIAVGLETLAFVEHDAGLSDVARRLVGLAELLLEQVGGRRNYPFLPAARDRIAPDFNGCPSISGEEAVRTARDLVEGRNVLTRDQAGRPSPSAAGSA
jgi:predicted ATPase